MGDLSGLPLTIHLHTVSDYVIILTLPSKPPPTHFQRSPYLWFYNLNHLIFDIMSGDFVVILYQTHSSSVPAIHASPLLFQAEFSGGVLMCNGVVSIRKVIFFIWLLVYNFLFNTRWVKRNQHCHNFPPSPQRTGRDLQFFCYFREKVESCVWRVRSQKITTKSDNCCMNSLPSSNATITTYTSFNIIF